MGDVGRLVDGVTGNEGADVGRVEGFLEGLLFGCVVGA